MLEKTCAPSAGRRRSAAHAHKHTTNDTRAYRQSLRRFQTPRSPTRGACCAPPRRTIVELRSTQRARARAPGATSKPARKRAVKQRRSPKKADARGPKAEFAVGPQAKRAVHHRRASAAPHHHTERADTRNRTLFCSKLSCRCREPGGACRRPPRPDRCARARARQNSPGCHANDPPEAIVQRKARRPIERRHDKRAGVDATRQ